MNDWKTGGAPYAAGIAALEQAHGLPADLLLRVAFQECSWRPEVIDYSVSSAPGAMGMFQLMPQDFPAVVNKRGWQTDGVDAAGELARLRAHYQDWQLSIAAYDWGEGHIDRLLAADMTPILDHLPTETANYVTKVFADVPMDGAILNA